MTVPALITIDQLNEALSDRLEELLPELIGGAKRGKEWIAASTREGGIGDSLGVALLGYKRGKWFHHAAGVGGDPLGLIAHARCNGDMKAAFAWARSFLGGKIPEETEKDRALRAQRLRTAERKERREQRALSGQARYEFFQKAQSNIIGTPAGAYLDNRLGGQLARLGRMPGSLRFHPALRNSQLDRDLPALVASIVDAQGEMIAMHRTWLVERDGVWDRLRGGVEFEGWGKDGREVAGKKVLGKFQGGTIRLWAGESVDGETGEVRRGVGWPKLGPGASIMLAEGIETGLSLALALPARRIVCAIAIEGFAQVVLPPCFSDVTIAADRDPGNPAAAGALDRAKQAHAAAGRTCRVVYPPEGIDDWNTALKQAAQRVA